MAKLTAETYTDAEQVALCKQGLAELTVAQSTTVRGKTYTKANIDELKELLRFWENRVASAAGQTRMIHTKHGRRC